MKTEAKTSYLKACLSVGGGGDENNSSKQGMKIDIRCSLGKLITILSIMIRPRRKSLEFEED